MALFGWLISHTSSADAEVQTVSGQPRPAQHARWLEQPFAQPTLIEPLRVRALYDQFVYVVGPAAKTLFSLELRTLGLRPSQVSAHGFDALVEGLSSRIPLASARASFLARAADVQ